MEPPLLRTMLPIARHSMRMRSASLVAVLLAVGAGAGADVGVGVGAGACGADMRVDAGRAAGIAPSIGAPALTRACVAGALVLVLLLARTSCIGHQSMTFEGETWIPNRQPKELFLLLILRRQ